jgi:ribosomal protein S18 acetylase RimI-like enzyme
MPADRAIRTASEDDAEALALLFRRFNDEYDEESPPHEFLVRRMAELMASGDGVFFLAGDGPDGFAYLQFNASLYNEPRDAYLGELYVVPGRRGEGLGRGLLQAAMDEARARGSTHFSITTSMDDDEARGLYESAGFTNKEGGPDGPLMVYYERDL